MKLKGKQKKKKNNRKTEIHFSSNAHKESIQNYHSFSKKSSHVDVKINEQQKKEVALDDVDRLCTEKIIHVLLDCCLYLCRQSLAFRRCKNEFKRNFNQLAHLSARWVPIIERWVGSTHLRPYKVAYSSKNSPNDYINLISNEICKLIAEEIVSAKFFCSNNGYNI